MLKEIPVTQVKADGSQRFTDRRASQQVTWTPRVVGGAPPSPPSGVGSRPLPLSEAYSELPRRGSWES